MWVTSIVYVFMTLTLSSDFVYPDSPIQCGGAPLQSLAAFTSIALFYASLRTALEKSSDGIFQSRLAVTISTTLTLGMPVWIEVLRMYMVSHDALVFSEYTALLHKYTEYSTIMSGAILSAMFTGNVLCALSSAEHHKAVTKIQIK